MSSKKSDKLKLKDIKEINTILCEYFASYCIHGKSVTGIPLNSGTRVYSTINDEDDQFTNIVVNNPLKFKSFLNDAKVTKTERHEGDKNIKLIYHSSNEGDVVFKIPKYTPDIETIKDANTPFQTKIINACRMAGHSKDAFQDGTLVPSDILDALANKKFVCIGGVIFAKSELPLTNKCQSAYYWNVYGDENDTEFSEIKRPELTKNYLVIALYYEKVTVYKLVAYAFPADEFNM